MNRKNAPWAAVRGEEGRLLGLLRGDEISGRVRAPETFLTAGELVAEAAPAARAIQVSPDAELSEAILQMEMAGSGAALVESPGRPPGVLEFNRAKETLSGKN